MKKALAQLLVCLFLLAPALHAQPFHGALTPRSVDCYGPTTVRGAFTAHGAMTNSTGSLTISTIVASGPVSSVGVQTLTTIVGSGGLIVSGSGATRTVAPDPDYVETGSLTIAPSATQTTLTFSTEKASADYAIMLFATSTTDVTATANFANGKTTAHCVINSESSSLTRTFDYYVAVND